MNAVRISIRYLIAVCGLLLYAVIPVASTRAAAESETTPIVAVVPDLMHLQKWDDMYGDTADPFWADDDNLYHFSCDGRGFGKEQRNLCFNKLAGPDILHMEGSLINSMAEYGKVNSIGADGATWKVAGQECIDGAFYAFVVRNIYGDKSKDPLMRQTSFNTSLVMSIDRGVTWTRSSKANYDYPMWPGRRFGGPGFIHYGKNGGQVERDNAGKFVYALSNNGFWNGGDDFILARVRRVDLPKLDVADWKYFAGGDGLQESSWSGEITNAVPVLSQPAKLGWTSPVFVQAFNRYLLVSWYVTPTLKKWFEPGEVKYDFYEAEHPWGPWDFVSSLSDSFLAKGQHMYGPNLCAKYQEKVGDDVKIDLYTSGCPFQDRPDGLYKNWRIPLILKSRPLPGYFLVNNNDPDIRYTGAWQASLKRGFHDYKDDIHYSRTAGDAAEYKFTGTGVELLSEKFGDQGSAEIFIDGQSRGSVNLKVDDFPRLSQIRVFSVQGLTNGPHVIKVVNTSSNYVAIDGFAISIGKAEK